MFKSIKITLIALSITGLAMALGPQPAEAFTLFGIKFFEKTSPTPTPTITPTPTPVPTVAGDSETNHEGDLPETGPEQNIIALMAVVASATVARKYWLVSKKLG